MESFSEPQSSVDEVARLPRVLGQFIPRPQNLSSPQPCSALWLRKWPEGYVPGCSSIKLVRFPEAKWKREGLGIRETQGITSLSVFSYPWQCSQLLRHTELAGLLLLVLSPVNATSLPPLGPGLVMSQGLSLWSSSLCSVNPCAKFPA